MISNLNSKINEFLNSEKIPKENFDDLKNVPENMEFSLLSKEFPELIDIIGYHGIVIEPLPVDEIVLKRIIERGKNFINYFLKTFYSKRFKSCISCNRAN